MMGTESMPSERDRRHSVNIRAKKDFRNELGQLAQNGVCCVVKPFYERKTRIFWVTEVVEINRRETRVRHEEIYPN